MKKLFFILLFLSAPALADVNVQTYGAVPDAIYFNDCTASGTGLTCPSANFAIGDAGKVIKITKGYTNDAVYLGTINSRTNITTIVLGGTVTTSCSGNCKVSYGTDNSTTIQNAINAAMALSINNSNKIKLFGPSDPNGGGYIIRTALTSDNLDIDFEAPIFSQVGIGSGDTTIPWDLGNSHIARLNIYANGGRGARLGKTGSHDIDIWDYRAWEVGFNGQQAMTCQGYGFNIDGGMGSEAGSKGFDWTGCSDIHGDGYISVVGANHPLIIKNVEDAQFNLVADTTSNDSFQIDDSHDIVLNASAFITGSNTACTGVIGSSSSGKSHGLQIRFNAMSCGGNAISVANVDGGVDIDINATNKQMNGQPTNNLTNAVTYGSGLSGTLNINVKRDSDIALYTGTQYGNLTDNSSGATTFYGDLSASTISVNGASPPSGDGFYNPASGVVTTWANGAPVLGAVGVPSPGNYAFISNSVSANPSAVTFGAAGTDANIIIALAGKGTGWVQFSPNTASGKGLIIKGVTSQTANLFEVQNVSNTDLAHFDGSGNFRANGTNVIIGNAALATNATSGFLYIPTTAGAPTGTPVTNTGTAPMVLDTTNSKLCIYRASAWRCLAGF